MPRFALPALLLSLLLPACGGSDTTPVEAPAEPIADAPDAEAAPSEQAAESAPAEVESMDGSLRELREESEVVRSIKPIEEAGAADPKKRTQLAMDTSKSTIGWVALKNGTAEIKGQFTALAGSLSIDPNDLRTATGEIGVDLLGISSGDQARDGNIAKIFFGARGTVPLHGQVSVTGIQPEVKSIAVGEKTRVLAQAGIALGGDVVGLVLPLELERLGAAHWKLTTLETLTVGIDELGLSGRKADLMKACQHESIGNGITATGSAIFGQADPQ
jgi:hypothetical protein